MNPVRQNIVFVVLVALLGTLVVAVVLRGLSPHAVQMPAASASAEPSASAPNALPEAPHASASATPELTPEKPKPKLGRTLRVTSLGWELAAPLLLANDGLEPKRDSELGKAGLDVAISIAEDAEGVEKALARGGTDEAGADVAIVPLPFLVTSFEHLTALRPVVFYVTGFSKGRDVLSGKHPLETLPQKGDVLLKGAPDDSATALALFALELSGVAPNRVKLTEDSDAKAELSARARAKLKPAEQGEVILSSAEASRFLPLVAIASDAFVNQQIDSLSLWAKAWLGGAKRLASDPTGSARSIAGLKDAPEPIALLGRLGEIDSADLAENAELAGASGRGAVTLESLFQRTWHLEREAKLVTVPSPEHAPIAPAVIAALVRSEPALSHHDKSASAKKSNASNATPILIERLKANALDEDRASEELAFVAGVFGRSNLRATAYLGGAADKTLAERLITRTVERYGMDESRLGPGNLPGKAGVVAAIEVLPLP